MFICWSFTTHSTLWMPQQTVELKWIVQTVHSHTHTYKHLLFSFFYSLVEEILTIDCILKNILRLSISHIKPECEFESVCLFIKCKRSVWNRFSIVEKYIYRVIIYLISFHNEFPFVFFYFIFKCDEEFRRENRVDEIKSTFMTFKSKENYKFDIF